MLEKVLPKISITQFRLMIPKTGFHFSPHKQVPRNWIIYLTFLLLVDVEAEMV